jgi:hypothetical protein
MLLSCAAWPNCMEPVRWVSRPFSPHLLVAFHPEFTSQVADLLATSEMAPRSNKDTPARHGSIHSSTHEN